MSNLAIIGAIEVVPGRRDQLLSLLKAHGARCLKDEPGTREDDTKVLIYEVYEDDDAFETHRRGRSIAQWREETAGMVVSVQVTKCPLVD